MSGDPDITLTDGNVAFEWADGKTAAADRDAPPPDADKASWRVRVDSFDRSGKLIGTEYDVRNGTPVKKEVKDIPVDMTATAAPYVGRVLVAVEMQGAGPNLVTKASNDDVHEPARRLRDDPR